VGNFDFFWSNFGPILARFFFKMQVIGVGFRLAISEFWVLESEILGMLEGAVIGYSNSFFPGK
jgi:hypothetical protein